jgi:heme exporter protein D
MTGVVLVSCLKAVLLLGSLLMALMLYRTGLYRRYPIFFAFFIFRILNSIWPMFLETSSDLYQKVWVLSTPIALGFYVLMVVELYKLVLEKYKGLYTLGRWAMYVSLAVSVTISVISLLPRIHPSAAQRSRIMSYVLATERGIDTALAIFIVLILCFLSLFPVKLSRNVRVHALVFSIFFLSNTFVLLMRSLFGKHLADEVNTVLLGVTAASVVAWLTLLRAAGEDTQSAPAQYGQEDESRLLMHLDSLNAALLRASGR